MNAQQRQYEQARRQQEFLTKLADLLDEYHAEISINNRRDDDGGPELEIDACGTWVHAFNLRTRLHAEVCREAAREAATYTEAIEPL